MNTRNDQLPGVGAQGCGLREQLAASTQQLLLKELAAGFAQELNQPLAAIAAYAEGAASLLRRNPARGSDVVDIIEAIAHEALRAGDTIQHMRDVVGPPPFRRQRLDCIALVRSLAPLLEALGAQQGVVFRFELSTPLPAVSGDAVSLQTLLLLLVRNTLDAVGQLPAGVGQVTISAHDDDGWIEIEVADNGPEMRGNSIRSMFKPYSGTRPDGTGLGLAACENIALQHGGKLQYRSPPSGGVRFCLRIPVADNGD